MANVSVAAPGRKPVVKKEKRETSRATTNFSANYLQVVTKEMLEDQVGLSICMEQWDSLCTPWILFFQFPLQLGAKFLVISLLTMSILGVLRRHHIPLATNQHTGAGVIRGIISSNNKSKSSSNSGRKVECQELAQSCTYLQLTQDRGMEGTIMNLTFVARYVRCAITRKACVGGSTNFGSVYIRATSQCIVGDPVWRLTCNDCSTK